MKKSTAASMTGFGGARVQSGKVRIDVEIRSVNSRFFDGNCKLPEIYSRFYQQIIEQAQKALIRGRVEVIVTRTSTGSADAHCSLDTALLDELISQVRTAAKRAGFVSVEEQRELLKGALPALLARKELLTVQQRDELVNAEGEKLQKALTEALTKLVRMRTAEGSRLLADVKVRLNELEKLQKATSSSAAGLTKRLREKITQRVDDALKTNRDAKLDAGRIAQEIAILADRADISEELTRLQSHIVAASQAMDSSEVGKKLDFLVQEMLRECNTISSKCQDAPTQHRMIEAKAAIEKIREQAQNLV